MYKTRIHVWGLDKNRKENEMRAIIRKRHQQQRQGKSPTFLVRGQAVGSGDIVRYLKRKGMSIEDVIAQRAKSPTPDAVVEFATPVPSKPSTPREFTIPENVIGCIRDYYQGSFESGIWYSKDPRLSCESVNAPAGSPDYLFSLHSQRRLACHLFANSLFQEAGRTLICATASIKKILQTEHPQTISDLFGLVMFFAHRNRPEIAIAILRQFADLGEVIVGVNHPLRRICGWLASLEASRFPDVLTVCLRSVSDRFERFPGPTHKSTLCSRFEYLQIANKLQDSREAVAATQKLLASCIRSLGSSDVRTLHGYMRLAVQYSMKGDYIAAQKVARQLIQCSQNVKPPKSRPYFHTQGLHLLAISQYRLGETASAEANLRQAIELRMSVCGTMDAITRIWLVDLEGWVAEQGKVAYAAQLHDWSCQILSSMEIEE